jgi:hypothetical protein
MSKINGLYIGSNWSSARISKINGPVIATSLSLRWATISTIKSMGFLRHQAHQPPNKPLTVTNKSSGQNMKSSCKQHHNQLTTWTCSPIYNLESSNLFIYNLFQHLRSIRIINLSFQMLGYDELTTIMNTSNLISFFSAENNFSIRVNPIPKLRDGYRLPVFHRPQWACSNASLSSMVRN